MVKKVNFSMKKQHILISFFLCFTLISIAQDKHFTQNFAAPLVLNPALTGGFEGRYRFSLIYRDQWRQALTQPYNTFAAGLDLRFPVNYLSAKTEDGFGVGMTFYTDRVGDIGFSTTELAFSTAYHKSLDERNNQYLSLGVQLGLNQRNITYEGLNFEDEFNGSNGFTGVTNELLPPNNFAFSDFAVGLNYSYAPKKAFGIFAGVAMHHIFQPQISFYYDRKDNDPEAGSATLDRRYTGHLSMQIPLTQRVTLLPRAVAMAQGPHLQVNAGANLRLAVGGYGGSAVHVGGWARPATNADNGFDVVAAILMVGFEIDNVLFGFSYDTATSSIPNIRQGQNAFEISITYLGNYNSETILCPKF